MGNALSQSGRWWKAAVLLLFTLAQLQLAAICACKPLASRRTQQAVHVCTLTQAPLTAAAP